MKRYFVLLQPYFLKFRNHLRKSPDKRQTIKRDLLLLGVSVLLLLTIYAGVVMVLNSVDNDLLFKELIPSKLLELLCYTFFLLQLLGALIAFTSNIFHSEAMNLHLTTPVSMPQMFLSKFIETCYETTFMFTIFTVPIAVAYIQVLDLPISFFLIGALSTIPFLIIANSLGLIASTFITYLTAVIWKRGLILVLGLCAVGIWLLSKLFAILNEVQLQKGGGNAIVHMIGLFDNPNPHWLPGNWLAGILTSFVYRDSYPVSTSFVLLCTTAMGTLAAAYLVFDIFSLKVRSRAFSHDGGTSLGSSKIQKSDVTRKLIEGIYGSLPIDQSLRAVILKDMTSLFRDRSQSLKLVMYLGIAVSYLILIKFMSSALILNVYGMSLWWAFLAGINALFGGFILTALMTRLVYPSISLEGKAFWIMNSAPIALKDLLKAKLLCWLPLSTLVSSSLLITGMILIQPSFSALFATLIVSLFLSFGCTALAVGIGAVFARFEWESANQISSGLGTLVLFFCSLIFVVIVSICSTGAYLVLIPPWQWSIHGVYLFSAISASTLILALGTSLFSRISLHKGAISLAEKRK